MQDQSCQDVSGITKLDAPIWSTFVSLQRDAPVQDMYDMLARGPVSVGVNASDWSSYTGGILDASEADCNPDGTNHAVALVAYTEGNGEMQEVTTTTTTPDMYYLTSCAYA